MCLRSGQNMEEGGGEKINAHLFYALSLRGEASFGVGRNMQ